MFMSCSQDVGREQLSAGSMIYMKDPTTNLCFGYAYFGGVNYNSQTCVPCDSLKNVKVGILNK